MYGNRSLAVFWDCQSFTVNTTSNRAAFSRLRFILKFAVCFHCECACGKSLLYCRQFSRLPRNHCCTARYKKAVWATQAVLSGFYLNMLALEWSLEGKLDGWCYKGLFLLLLRLQLSNCSSL